MRARAAIGVACACLAAGALTACVATDAPPPARGVVVTVPPPPPIVELAPATSRPGSQYVAGYWHWTGMQYAWIPGHWESPPAGATWHAPRYSTTNGAYVYEPGAWTGTSNASAFR